jgi:hypothetical protein
VVPLADEPSTKALGLGPDELVIRDGEAIDAAAGVDLNSLPGFCTLDLVNLEEAP